MAEVRRITTAAVDWASFDAGKVLTVSTGRRGYKSVGNSSGSCVSEARVFSDTGVLLAQAKLPDVPDGGIDAATNSSDVLVCCATHEPDKGQRTTVTFVSGPQVKVHELPRMKRKPKVRRHSVVCIRNGFCDVALYILGTGELFSCTRGQGGCHVRILYDFGNTCPVRILSGRTTAELIVLLDDGCVAVAELYESSDRSILCRITHLLRVSSSATPTHAAFAGGSALWVMCDDYSLCAYWFPPNVRGGAMMAVDEEVADCSVTPVRLLDEQLSVPAGSEDVGRIFLAGESRAYGIHLAVQTPVSVNFSSLPLHSSGGPGTLPTVGGWSHSVFVWSGHIHDLAFRQRAYELLVQNELGSSSLNIISLRQNASVLIFGDLNNKQLCHQVVCAAPTQLAGLREECESLVRELETEAAVVRDQHSVESAIRKLLDLQHCMVATLHRERELNRDLMSYQSISMHLIRRLHIVYIRLSVYQFLHTVGAQECLDVPLREVLGLDSIRQQVCTLQTELRKQFQQEFDLLEPASSMEALKLWGSEGSAPSMCIDAILSHVNCTDGAPLRSIVQQVASLKPEIALLVLYCTFTGPHCYHDYEKRSARVQFLSTFCLPASVDSWAYLAYAADHCICPTLPAREIGSPPFLDIIPGILSGLTHSGAYESVFHLIGSTLAITTVGTLPSSVAVKLLYLAYKRGSTAVLETLFRRSDGTPWHCVATRVLAWAALQTADIKIFSGLIKPQSPEEEIVETVLRRFPDPAAADVLRLDFYILMQRYADALQVCERITANCSVDAQKLQVVASHLRSLMPNGNVSYSHRPSMEGRCDEMFSAVGGQAGSVVLSTKAAFAPPHTATLSICPLQNEEQQLEEDVARAASRISALRHEGRPLDIIVFGNSQSRSSANAVPASSVSVAETQETNVVSHGQERAPECLSPVSGAHLGNDSISTLDGSLLTQAPATSGSAAVAETVTFSVGSATQREQLYCEAILKRSKKPCGRVRPCEYHDRVRK
ncbi:hypothetical protein, conserved [Trypanosoma brucei brucei TREU927]|uniref:Uncharacterized protein n=1 Tax=Trypanosoma brucei brucei (strain 927/4 GUTat10.1) TaxID=185431 RepID=Q381I7_TRYB2|nr:hypothetical protein, conserved [Trypanosoma brucei brucei TREU927]EAN80544.1 hypothetical protein, conserved [Trypanosoma brucei brucei TREU927]